MEWNELYRQLNNIKVDFEKSYKSLTQNRPTQKNTIKKHVEILVKCLMKHEYFYMARGKN